MPRIVHHSICGYGWHSIITRLWRGCCSLDAKNACKWVIAPVHCWHPSVLESCSSSGQDQTGRDTQAGVLEVFSRIIYHTHNHHGRLEWPAWNPILWCPCCLAEWHDKRHEHMLGRNRTPCNDIHTMVYWMLGLYILYPHVPWVLCVLGIRCTCCINARPIQPIRSHSNCCEIPILIEFLTRCTVYKLFLYKLSNISIRYGFLMSRFVLLPILNSGVILTTAEEEYMNEISLILLDIYVMGDGFSALFCVTAT